MKFTCLFFLFFPALIVQSQDMDAMKAKRSLVGDPVLVSGITDVRSAVFSADSKQIYCTTDYGLRKFDVETGEELDGVSFGRLLQRPPSFSSNGKHAAVVFDGDAGAYVCDIETGGIVLSLQQESITALDAQFLPNGVEIAVCGPDALSGNGVLTIWDAVTGEIKETYPFDFPWSAYRLILDPNGRWILFSRGAYAYCLFDLITGDMRQIWVDSPYPIDGIRGGFTADGNYIAAFTGEHRDRSHRLVFRTVPDGNIAQTYIVAYDRESPGTLAFTPDGTRFAVSYSETVTTHYMTPHCMIYDILRSTSIANLSIPIGTFKYPISTGCSPDSAEYFAIYSDGTLRIWDISEAVMTNDPGINTTENFPDAGFRHAVQVVTEVSNGAHLSEEEAASFTGSFGRIDYDFYDVRGIEFLTGVTGITFGTTVTPRVDLSGAWSLEYVNASGGGIYELDLSGLSKLKTLILSDTSMTEIDLAGCPLLETITFNDLWLQSLDLSANSSLQSIDIDNCAFESIELANQDNLVYLRLAGTHLASLDLSECPAVEELVLTGNLLTSIDLSNNPSLARFACSDCPLESIDLSQAPSLEELQLSRTQLSQIDVSPLERLHYFDCSYMPLSSLHLDGSAPITQLNCSGCGLEELDLSNCDTLVRLTCGSNAFASLDVSGLSELTSIWCPESGLTGIQWEGCTKLLHAYLNGNEFTSIAAPSMDFSQVPNLIALDIRDNLLDCGDWDDVQEQMIQVEYAAKLQDNPCEFYYSPQKTTDNYDCSALEENINTSEHFPDPVFRKTMQECTGIRPNDPIGKWRAAKIVGILDCPDRGITSFQGIEYFRRLKILRCGGNRIVELDLSRNPYLNTLWCEENQLETLDLSGTPFLETLVCHTNKLQSLDLSGHSKLTHVWCQQNEIEELHLSRCSNLEVLVCFMNRLRALVVSDSPLLSELLCNRNELMQLDLADNQLLVKLSCHSNRLTSLDLSRNANLRTMWCYGNQIDSLDLTNNPILRVAICYDNEIMEFAGGSTVPYQWIDLRNNRLDCGDWAVIEELLEKIGPWDEILDVGLLYSPQKGMDPYECTGILGWMVY